MDTLDKLDIMPTNPISNPGAYGEDLTEADSDAGLDDAELADGDRPDLAEKVAEATRRVNWWKVAGYAAAGVVVAGAAGGYLYWRGQQRKPLSRLERLKSQLGFGDVDFRDLKATIDKYDFEALNQSRRQLGSYAKKATHAGAKKVAELTR